MPKNLTIKSRLVFLTGFLSMQLVIGGVIGLVSLNNANEAMLSIYDDRLVPLGQLDRICVCRKRPRYSLHKVFWAAQKISTAGWISWKAI
jgi:hypothetical protein